MTDTLILFKPLAEFGEALKKECQNNDFTLDFCGKYTDCHGCIYLDT